MAARRWGLEGKFSGLRQRPKCQTSRVSIHSSSLSLAGTVHDFGDSDAHWATISEVEFGATDQVSAVGMILDWLTDRGVSLLVRTRGLNASSCGKPLARSSGSANPSDSESQFNGCYCAVSDGWAGVPQHLLPSQLSSTLVRFWREGNTAQKFHQLWRRRAELSKTTLWPVDSCHKGLGLGRLDFIDERTEAMGSKVREEERGTGLLKTETSDTVLTAEYRLTSR
ncbi:hypothetical protein EDB80DRAFT_674275 [Ilyonectria destructans]|nr:hypothetical protein EDB80DRAFT_674275 [Ilyonectria destructans]